MDPIVVPPTAYFFSMDRWSPATIPMKRLAQYLEKLAALFGSPGEVHFVKIKHGSAQPHINVAPDAASAVWSRLQAANDGDDGECASIRKSINRMLMEDDQTGYLRVVKGPKVIEFPGRKTPLQEEAELYEIGTLEGVLIRVGGRDESVPVQIDAGDGIYHRCNTSRSLAKELGKYLFEGEIRVTGKGRWHRNQDGEWNLLSFDIAGFEPLEKDSLGDFVRDMRAIDGSEWNKTDDPQSLLKQLKDD
jgi:hypothetical protein